MIDLRITSIVALVLGCLTSQLSADPLQERLEQIADDVSRLTLGALSGSIDPDLTMTTIEALTTLDVNLRRGKVSVDDLTLRWRDQGATPLKSPGAGLIAVGVPPGFTGPVWGLLEDGRKVEVPAELSLDNPYAVHIIVPDHPDGPEATGSLALQFAGAGSLRVDLAPRLDIPNALPILVSLAIGDLVKALEADGINADALLAQFRRDASAIPPELGYAAASLYIWSEAGQGDPIFGFLRTGRQDGPFWDQFAPPADPDALNRLYASALQNSGALERLMQLDRARIDKIRFVPPDPRPKPRFRKIKTQAGQSALEPIGLRELSDLVTIGRAREYRREVILNSAKDAQKVLDYGAFEPVTMTGAALAGAVLTLSEKYIKANDHAYPVKIQIKGDAVPADNLLADDERKVFPNVQIIATGAPYEVKVFSDGLDASLAVLDLASNLPKVGGAFKAIGKAAGSKKVSDAAAEGLELAKDVLLGKATSITKDALGEIEKEGDKRNKGSFNAYTVPGRRWVAQVESYNFRRYLSVGYRGEVTWDPRDYHAKACWKNTNEGISSTVMTKADRFGGLFDRADFGWGVETPTVQVNAHPPRIRPGEKVIIRAETSGATKTRVQFSNPPIGALSDVQNFSATYSAPSDIKACKEFVPISATFPTDSARICARPPQGSGGVIIAKGDALIRSASTLTCRDGEVVEFNVNHPDGIPVQCRLNGPGKLTMIAETGVLECAVKPKSRSSITCYSGQQPDQCAPVIPIKRIYPDFAVYAQVTAQRRSGDRLNDAVKGFFKDCGIDDATAVMLDVMDLGTGAADALDVDPVSNPCSAAAGQSQLAGGSSSTLETNAEGRHVAIWPLGDGRDISVSDSFAYYDPPASWETWERFEGDISASITFDGPERFSVRTDGMTQSSAADGKPKQVSGGSAEWSVWRRILVDRDTAVSANISTSGPATMLVTVVPMRLADQVPVSLLSGFDQNQTSAMIVGNVADGGVVTPQSDTSTVILPGPRGDADSLTYLLRFAGTITPAQQGQNQMNATSRTGVNFDIRPVTE